MRPARAQAELPVFLYVTAGRIPSVRRDRLEVDGVVVELFPSRSRVERARVDRVFGAGLRAEDSDHHDRRDLRKVELPQAEGLALGASSMGAARRPSGLAADHWQGRPAGPSQAAGHWAPGPGFTVTVFWHGHGNELERSPRRARWGPGLLQPGRRHGGPAGSLTRRMPEP